MQFLTDTAKASVFGLQHLESDSVVCDPVTGLPDAFEADRYMGLWYEIYHSANQPFQPDAWTCTQAEYSDLDSEGNFKVYNSSKSRFGGPRFGLHGDAKCPADEAAGECFVTFFKQPFVSEPNYSIIDTDYENYSIVYSCDESDMQYLWFLSRESTLSDELYNQMLATVQEKLPNYDLTQFIMDNQSDKKCGN